jgi:hypothetical protein
MNIIKKNIIIIDGLGFQFSCLDFISACDNYYYNDNEEGIGNGGEGEDISFGDGSNNGYGCLTSDGEGWGYGKPSDFHFYLFGDRYGDGGGTGDSFYISEI